MPLDISILSAHVHLNNVFPFAPNLKFSNPDNDSQLLASVEQAFPVRSDLLKFTRVRLRASKPLHLGPLSLHLKVRREHH